MIKEKEENITTSIMLPESVWKRAKIFAVEQRTSLSKMVRELLTEYMEKVE